MSWVDGKGWDGMGWDGFIYPVGWTESYRDRRTDRRTDVQIVLLINTNHQLSPPAYISSHLIHLFFHSPPNFQSAMLLLVFRLPGRDIPVLVAISTEYERRSVEHMYFPWLNYMVLETACHTIACLSDALRFPVEASALSADFNDVDETVSHTAILWYAVFSFARSAAMRWAYGD